jgi:hypothetical protein
VIVSVGNSKKEEKKQPEGFCSAAHRKLKKPPTENSNLGSSWHPHTQEQEQEQEGRHML